MFFSSDTPKPVTTVEGLRWGNYVCSPALPVPFISFNQAIGFPVSSLVCNRGEVVHVLCQDTTLMSGYEQYPEERGERLVLSAALSWSAVDGSLTVFVEGSGSGAWLMDTKTPDKVDKCFHLDAYVFCKLFIAAMFQNYSRLR